MLLGGAGVAYTLLSAVFVARFFGRTQPRGTPQVALPALTVLKPLHGAEPELRRDLQSVFDQDYPGDLQIVFGVQAPGDPARAVAEAAMAAKPATAADLIVDARSHGRNGKVSNLINMMAKAKNPVLLLSDSDIRMPPDHARRIGALLAEPDVGVVTCPYFGEGVAGFWSELAAMGLSYQFLPNVVTGVSLGLAHPCMGSTIALRRETLERIGGFESLRDVLADDYAIGAAVRGLGQRSVTAPLLVSHSCVEASLGAVFRHEVRWARTVRGVDPGGHAGSLVTHPIPWTLAAVVLTGFSGLSLGLFTAAWAARVWLMRVTDRAIGRKLGSWWLIPLRDMLSFAVFVGSFFVRSVEWRAAKFQVSKDGDLKPV